MKKIGILGGSFNPPTKGHVQLAKFVLSKTDLDEVWLMPCYDHRLKDLYVTPLYRYDMCRIACIDEPNIVASPYEIIHKHNGSVYDLFYTMSKDRDMEDYKFSFIIGADNVVIFDLWRNSEELKKIVRFITVPRQGVKIPEDIVWHKNCPHIFLEENNPIIEVSATEVRSMLCRWWSKTLSSEELDGLKNKIDDKVLKYIGNHSLYIRSGDEQREQGRIPGIS